MRMRHVIATVLILVVSPLQAAAPDKSDHPLISAYEGSSMTRKDVKEFDEYRAFTGVDAEGLPSGPTLEGKVTKMNYKNPPDRSVLEIFRNYEMALKSAGAQILHQCDQGKQECVAKYAQSALGKHNGMSAISNTAGRYIIGKIQQDGQVAYVSIGVGPSFTNIDVAEIKAMDTGMVALNAAALGEGIDRNGYIIVEGIYFDTDKTTVKPESRPALDEVAKLLGQRKDLKLYVVGHTDMQGTLAHNMQLSQGRAQAVVAQLTGAAYGIDAARLEGLGVGPLSPQATNVSDGGRAKNRRVVLVAR